MCIILRIPPCIMWVQEQKRWSVYERKRWIYADIYGNDGIITEED